MSEKDKQGQDTRATPLTYRSTTFLGMAKIVKFKEFQNWSSLWAFIVTACFLMAIAEAGDFSATLMHLNEQLDGTLLASSSAILAVVITALTVTVALFHESLLPRLLNEGLLHKFLFPFWFAASIWGVNIAVCIILYVIAALGFSHVESCLFVIELLIFLFGVFYTVSLTGQVIRLSLQRAQILK